MNESFFKELETFLMLPLLKVRQTFYEECFFIVRRVVKSPIDCGNVTVLLAAECEGT